MFHGHPPSGDSQRELILGGDARRGPGVPLAEKLRDFREENCADTPLHLHIRISEKDL